MKKVVFILTLLIGTFGLDNEILTQFSQLSENVIDDGLDLLSELYCTVLQDLHHNAPSLQLHAMERQLQSIKERRDIKSQQCQQMDEDLVLLKDEEQKNQKFIIWLNERISKNKDRINIISEQGCISSNQYLALVSAQTKILKLIQFLREALENSGKASFSELDHTVAFLEQVKFSLSQYQQDALNEQFTQLQDKLEGPYVDIISIFIVLYLFNKDDQKAGKKQDSQQVRLEMLDLLDQIKNFVEQSQLKIQRNQISSLSGSERFLYELQREIDLLKLHLDQITKLIGSDPNSVLSCKIKQKNQCQDDLRSLDLQIHASELTISTFDIGDEDKDLVARLLQQANILKEIIIEYSKGIQNINSDYKRRIQEILDNQTENSQFDNRALGEKFSGSEGNLDQITDQIAKKIQSKRRPPQNAQAVSFIQEKSFTRR